MRALSRKQRTSVTSPGKVCYCEQCMRALTHKHGSPEANPGKVRYCELHDVGPLLHLLARFATVSYA